MRSSSGLCAMDVVSAGTLDGCAKPSSTCIHLRSLPNHRLFLDVNLAVDHSLYLIRSLIPVSIDLPPLYNAPHLLRVMKRPGKQNADRLESHAVNSTSIPYTSQTKVLVRTPTPAKGCLID